MTDLPTLANCLGQLKRHRKKLARNEVIFREEQIYIYRLSVVA